MSDPAVRASACLRFTARRSFRAMTTRIAPRSLSPLGLVLLLALSACGGGDSSVAPPACRLAGEGCSSSAACCSGLCGPASTCVEPCGEMFDACTSSGQCCADLGCTGGTVSSRICWTCAGLDASCTGDNDCCSGLDCRGTKCLAGTCSTQAQPCSGNAECCAHLRCEGGACTCGGIGQTCGSTLDCCGGYACGPDFVCHPQDVGDGGRCLADADCRLGNCAGVTATPGTCCQDSGTSCAGAGATCCGGSVCRGPADGSQACGACLPLLSTPCYRTIECCAGNLCDAGRCCKPTTSACASAEECCNGRCGLYQNGTGGSNHCCGGPLAACRLDQASTCCDGFQCYGSGGGPWPNGVCLPKPGSDCGADADCLYRSSGSVCIPRDATPGAPTVCSAWIDQACSAQIPCPGPLVCDATTARCAIPPGEACSYSPYCATGTDCDRGVCCSHPGSACGGDVECCAGTCDGTGSCACGVPGVHCSAPKDCCTGEECHWLVGGGNDDYACCALEQSSCTAAADCCDARLSCEGVCCRPAGSGCAWWEADAALPCCGGTTCKRFIDKGVYSYGCK